MLRKVPVSLVWKWSIYTTTTSKIGAMFLERCASSSATSVSRGVSLLTAPSGFTWNRERVSEWTYIYRCSEYIYTPMVRPPGLGGQPSSKFTSSPAWPQSWDNNSNSSSNNSSATATTACCIVARRNNRPDRRCRVVSGEPRFSGSMEWDISARPVA